MITPDAQTGKYKAQVLEWSALKTFCAAHPDYSFLVPQNEQAALEAQMPRHDFMWAHQNGVADGALVWSQFEVTPLGNGRQKLVVSGSWLRNNNASVRGWYEAENRTIHPKYMNEGDTYAVYMLDALLLVGALDLAGLLFYLRRRWKSVAPAVSGQHGPVPVKL